MERQTKHSRHGLVDLEPSQVAARLAEVKTHLDAIDALLADAEGMTTAERRKAPRLRGDGEVAALSGILRFAAAHGELFSSLADEDEGNDPSVFETQLLMNRLQNSQTLVGLAGRLASMESRVSSSAQRAVTLVKPAALKAYQIAKAVGRVSRSALIHPAQDFYGASARAAAKTRARKKGAGKA